VSIVHLPRIGTKPSVFGFVLPSGSQCGARFSAPVQTVPVAHPASYKRGTIFSPAVKCLGRGDGDPPPPSCADVKERVELYLYSTSGASWLVLAWPLPLPLPLPRSGKFRLVPKMQHCHPAVPYSYAVSKLTATSFQGLAIRSILAKYSLCKRLRLSKENVGNIHSVLKLILLKAFRMIAKVRCHRVTRRVPEKETIGPKRKAVTRTWRKLCNAASC